MKLTKLSALAIATIALPMALTSCDDTTNGGEETKTGTVLTPDENKQELEDIVKQAAGMLNPDNQKEAVDFFTDAADMIEDLDIPSNWETIVEKGRTTSPAKIMRGLASALTRGNYLEPATKLVVYNLKFNDFKGVYTADYKKGEWVRTADSNDITFNFTDSKGKACQLQVKGDGADKNMEIPITWWDWEDGYDENGNWWVRDVEVKNEFNVVLPGHFVTTITCAGKTMAAADANHNIDQKGHSAAMAVFATVADINIESVVSANDNKVEISGRIAVGDKPFATVNANVTGSHLCDEDWYRSFENLEEIEDDDEYEKARKAKIKSTVSGGYAESQLIGKLRVDANIANVSKFIDGCEAYGCFDNWDYDSVGEAYAACQKACNDLNEGLSTGFYYGAETLPQGSIFFAPVEYDSYGSYNKQYFDYHVGQKFRFASDESVYELEDYFNEGRFPDAADTFESLFDSYYNLFGW